jgi:hypothetical protein
MRIYCFRVHDRKSIERCLSVIITDKLLNLQTQLKAHENAKDTDQLCHL